MFSYSAGDSPGAGENVPSRYEPDLLGPLQQLDVLRSGDALFHPFQNVCRKAFDPRLNADDAAAAHNGELPML
jgi:hypothetical protein